MKLLKYVVKHDAGLAPNPFNGYCTLAVCTPNHMGAKLEEGDWILGHSTVAAQNKLIYLMQLTEPPMHFDHYFNDARFRKKIPDMTSNDWQMRLGDNMYYLKNNVWKKIKSDCHDDEEAQTQDLKHPFVFISEYFYYFGKDALPMNDFQDFIWRNAGYKYIYDESRIMDLLDYVKKVHIYGPPIPNNSQIICKDVNTCT